MARTRLADPSCPGDAGPRESVADCSPELKWPWGSSIPARWPGALLRPTASRGRAMRTRLGWRGTRRARGTAPPSRTTRHGTGVRRTSARDQRHGRTGSACRRLIVGHPSRFYRRRPPCLRSHTRERPIAVASSDIAAVFTIRCSSWRISAQVTPSPLRMQRTNPRCHRIAISVSEFTDAATGLR